MVANIIDGKAIATSIRQDVKKRVDQLLNKGIQPTLVVIVVGNNPASAIYVRNKIKACHEVGVRSIKVSLSDDTTEQSVLKLIEELNTDTNINGILVQLPLPKHIDEHRILEKISPEKDVDGFHLLNAGRLLSGLSGFRPCTPSGVIRMLELSGLSFEGKHAVVVGRSNIVGKPMALMFLERNCTVSIVHSKTKELASITRQADILVSAVGKPRMISANMVKPGSIVVDVGINRDTDGKLCGDVDFDTVSEVAGWITPVPGGVGPMTIAILLDNTVKSAESTL
ncbi:MAG: bifunctional methylenetetrahydrofolate dehydrogenase/methenyltetrahydrofolate cyclohydrolase FolD [Burkholderiaceae bacterium]|nr:bifunctional methylenetetrahydrofolate dehydrogenase/methenyltetrahydrofolate cyclohydrolase FolD [Burkholderiaceae bacterium]